MTATRAILIAALAGALGASAVTPAVGGTVEHEVRRGDNLHLLAGYYYRDPRLWKRIWRENRAHLRNASRLKVGAVLRVPLEDGAAWGEIPYEEFVARVHRGR